MEDNVDEYLSKIYDRCPTGRDRLQRVCYNLFELESEDHIAAMQSTFVDYQSSGPIELCAKFQSNKF